MLLNSKYAGDYIAGIGKHKNKLEKVVKILDRLCTEGCNQGELPKLVELIEACLSEHADAMEWGVKFGFSSPSPGESSRKRRRK